MPVQRLVRSHLDFFNDLRDAGGSWDQIARLLRDEGLVSRSGEIVEAAVLRVLYSRAMKERPPGHAGRQSLNVGRGKDVSVPPKNAKTSPKSAPPEPCSLAERLERVARLRGPMRTEE